MPELTLKNIPFTADSDNRLRTLKARTGLDRNYLCRIGYCLSLEEPGQPEPIPKETRSARDIDRYTLLGQQGPAYIALLLIWMRKQGIPSNTPEAVNSYFIAHVNRGVEIVTSRVKTLVDIGTLLPQPQQPSAALPRRKNPRASA
jgi:DNA sulfur modification protein DndE